MTTIILLFFWISHSYLTLTLTNFFGSLESVWVRDFVDSLTLLGLVTIVFIRLFTFAYN